MSDARPSKGDGQDPKLAKLVEQYGPEWQTVPPTHNGLRFNQLAVGMPVRVCDRYVGDYTTTVVGLDTRGGFDYIKIKSAPGKPHAIEASTSEYGMNPTRQGHYNHWRWLESAV